MKNAEYWRGRFSILEDAAQKGADRYISDLEKVYRAAEQGIQKDLEAWYGRFAANNGISLTDARKMLTTGQLKEFQWSVEQYIKTAQQANLSPEWIKKLENASARFHISRLESLQLQIQQQAELLYGNQLDGLDSLLKDVVSNGYNHTAFEIQRGLGLGWDITALDQKKLEKLLSRPWTADGKTFRDRCWENKANLISGIQSTLTQGILRGQGLQTITDNIKKQFGVSRYKAGRLAHTETTYFNAVSAKETYGELNVEKVEILETLDSITCDVCGSLDGTVIPLSQFEPGVTVPPFHPNCRGTTCPYFDDGDGKRAARNEDGEIYYVPANMDYTTWKETFVDGGSKDKITPVVDPQTVKDKITAREADIKQYQRDLDQVQIDRYELRADERRYRDLINLSDSELKAIQDKGDFNDYRRVEMFKKWKAGKADNFDFQKEFAAFDAKEKLLQEQIKAAQKDIENLRIELTNAENGVMMKIAGVERGSPMSFTDADTGHVNPNYGTAPGYSINCQSCVVTFEARQRGFNVQVLPNTKGSVLEQLSYKTNLAWIDPATGLHPEYLMDETATTAKKYLAFLQDTIEPGKRYTIQFGWKGRHAGGHIVNLDRTASGQLRIKDNQRGKNEQDEWIGDKAVYQYLSYMKYTGTSYGMKYYCGPRLLRIDNMNFDLSIVNAIMEAVK